MRGTVVRTAGLACALGYGAFIVWLYAQQPRTVAQVTGGIQAHVGLYVVDQAAFEEAVDHFRHERFPAARVAFERADPARRDPATQFYIAYSYYRQGWGRLYHDDALYRAGLEAVDQAARLAPGGRFVTTDASLPLRSSDELRAELQRGIDKDPSDFNPLKVFRARQ
jgi:hypothetical protein